MHLNKHAWSIAKLRVKMSKTGMDPYLSCLNAKWLMHWNVTNTFWTFWFTIIKGCLSSKCPVKNLINKDKMTHIHIFFQRAHCSSSKNMGAAFVLQCHDVRPVVYVCWADIMIFGMPTEIGKLNLTFCMEVQR